jgi:thymidylate kinase
MCPMPASAEPSAGSAAAAAPGSAGRPPDRPPLRALVELFSELNRLGIPYCHWKSNSRLAEAMSGETDLDLLVSRAHAGEFLRFLFQRGLKRVLPPPSRSYPAVEEFLGFDDASGRLFHLHVHYRLVLGQQHTKNHCLPLEGALLQGCGLEAGVRIPPPEVELVVLCMRALLKYRSRDFLRDLLGRRGPGIPLATREEMALLWRRTGREAVAAALAGHGSWLSGAPVLDLLDHLLAGGRSGWRLLGWRRRLLRLLAPYRREPPWLASIRYGAGIARKWKEGVAGPIGKTLPAGGVTLAVIGPDGAGKSTLVKDLAEWLSWKLRVRTFYMGSNQPSPGHRLASFAHRLCLSVERRIRARGERGLLAGSASHLAQGLAILRHLAAARDRAARHRAGLRAAANGAVVIFERFPLKQLHAVMDGPRIESGGPPRGSLGRWCARLESRLYDSIAPPERVFALYLDAGTAHARKPDHEMEMVQAKAAAVEALRETPGLVMIDASRPLDEVRLALKCAVWPAL